MASKIKGITLQIGGDTSGLTKALSKVNSETNSIQKELKDVEKSLKLDPKNVELLEQKQQLLNDAIETTQDKLTALKKAKEKADKDMASGTEVNEKQYRLLQREIVNTQESLKILKTQSDKANSSLGDVDKNKKSFSDFKFVLSGVTKGTAAFAAAGAAVAAVLSEVEESTREYRTDLAKLKTNAKEAGIGFAEIKKQLNSVITITDEADSSIEALSNLLRTNISEGGLEQIVKELSGAVIAFPDTLKIESLADGLQETLATGNAVGQFSELLERCGINLDDFNAGLERSKSSVKKNNIY